MASVCVLGFISLSPTYRTSIQHGVLPIRLLVRHYAHSAINALTASDYKTGQTLMAPT